MDWIMVMKRESCWWTGLVVAAITGVPAWADPALDSPTAVLVPASSYELPSRATLSPAVYTTVSGYRALSGLDPATALAMDKAAKAAVIPGPDLSYRAGSRGPMVEIAALGGGMDSAPSLAHVGFDWIF